MSVQVPIDVESSILSLVAKGQFPNEAEVLRAAMVALQRQEEAASAILEGMEDESAGRLTPARQVVETAAALEYRKNVEAIKEGIADMEAGRYRPLEEIDAEIRKKFGFKAS